MSSSARLGTLRLMTTGWAGGAVTSEPTTRAATVPALSQH
jgi:hypothetical protein